MEDNRYDFYGSFNLSNNASEDEIRISFRRLSRFLHPDKQQTHNKKVAEAAFSRLQYLKEVLTNSTTRYIYDTYGELGLSLAVNKKYITSFVIDDMQKRKDFDMKMKEMLLKAQFQKMQSAINYKGLCAVNFSIADYFDSRKTFRNSEWKERFLLTSLSLNEVVRFHLTPRLVFDAGVLFHHNDSDSSMDLTGRLAYRFDSGIMAQCNYQLGNSFTSTYSLSKNIGNTNFYVQANLANSQITPSFTAMRMYDENKSIRLDISAGIHPTASLSMDHTVSESAKAYYKIHQGSNELELEAGVSYKVLKMITFRVGSKITSKVVKNSNVLLVHPKCGFSTRINGMVSVGYGVETDSQGVSVFLKVKRGEFVVQVPVRVSKFITPNKLAFLAGATFLATVLTHLIGRSIGSLQGAFSKSETQKFKESEKYNDHNHLVQEIKSIAKQNRQTEKLHNGLVILKAYYGKLGQPITASQEAKTIDIKWILQAQVNDSAIFLTPSQLSKLSGVFEPCSRAKIYIQYKYGSRIFERVYKSKEAIIIP